MALFNRNRNQIDQVPVEVQEYYQAERRERTGMAWLLALGTLAATIALAAALFYGGKWAYRAIANRDKKPQTVQNTNNQNSPSPATNDASNGTPGASTGTSSTSTDAPSSSTPSNTGNSGASQQSTGTTGSTGSGSATSGTGTAAQSSRLVNTGPSNVVASFIIVSAGGAIVHYAYAVRRSRS